jgi:hypothetical protein
MRVSVVKDLHRQSMEPQERMAVVAVVEHTPVMREALSILAVVDWGETAQIMAQMDLMDLVVVAAEVETVDTLLDAEVLVLSLLGT